MNGIDKYSNSLEKLSESASLNDVMQVLMLAFVSQRFLSRNAEISFESIKKAGWICSILADSENEQHKAKAQTFAILLHLYGKNRENYDKLSYIILSRLGNLLSTKF